MVKFAEHYFKTTPWRVAKYAEGGDQPTDEMLLEALELIEPPLLLDKEHVFAVSELSRKRGRRVRIDRSRRELAEHILELSREDVPHGYLVELAKRIAAGKGVTEFERSRKFYRKHSAFNRDQMIRHAYTEFDEHLGDERKATYIEHEIFGRVPVPAINESRSFILANMVHQYFTERLWFFMPSERRILNIVSAAKYGRYS